MSAHMESLTTEFRIAGRILRETVMGLRRSGWMNVIVVITMASILSIFGIWSAVIMEMDLFILRVGSELEISTYVDDDVDPYLVQNKILALPHVKKVTLVKKDDAWTDMQKKYQLPSLEDNPLPDTIHVQVDNEQYINSTVNNLRNLEGVEHVQYAKAVLDKIRQFTRGASIVGVLALVFFGVLTIFIISNTIHLLIQAKSREIEILRMMGVGNWYIKLPFLMQGGLYGLISAGLAYFPLSIALYYIMKFFAYFDFETSTYTLGVITMLLVLMGILVGAGGSFIAVRKYLHI